MTHDIRAALGTRALSTCRVRTLIHLIKGIVMSTRSKSPFRKPVQTADSDSLQVPTFYSHLEQILLRKEANLCHVDFFFTSCLARLKLGVTTRL